MKTFTAAETARLLPFQPLVDMLRATLLDYQAGQILCPARTILSLPGRSGQLISMPVMAPDLLATKLLTILDENRTRGLPTIQGQVMCMDARNGAFLFALDGTTTTERRTAALSMLALERFAPSPSRVLLIGTGAQARVHLEALNTLHPGLRVDVRGRSPERVKTLLTTIPCPALTLAADDPAFTDHDVVITVTSSRDVLFDAQPSPKRLVIGVGAYRPDMVEVGPMIVAGSLLIVDDPVGAPSEAGDFIQAGTDWKQVRSLADMLQTQRPVSRPVFFKSVGCAAWDLAACRLVRASLADGTI